MTPGDALLGAGLVVALAAAARSTWSPCGLSMMSSITPLGEAGRGQRFRVTAGWFVAGAVAGGATLGGLCALAAAAASALGPSGAALLGVGAVACALAAAWDLGMLGLPMPVMRRQVDELWLDRYRGWVYGAGFGWQIGVGLATYIMTAGVIALIPLAAATRRPWEAFVFGVVFGGARGLTVLTGRSVDGPEALRAAHHRLDRLRRPVRLGVALVLAAVGVALGARSGSLLLEVAIVVACVAVLQTASRVPRVARLARAARLTTTGTARR